MRKPISLDSFDAVMRLLSVLNSLSVLDDLEYLVVWEKRPKLTLNRLGNFEFANPQEVYGAVLSFWNERGERVGEARFVLVERFDDDA